MTGNQTTNDFSFFLPLDIEKSGEGKKKMIFRGIASTPDIDTDGEMLDPKGFDLSYFVNNGFINWNHKAKEDPSAIIGEPIVAKITKEGLYLESELYADNETAQKVYKLAESLEKSKSGRKLGYSIEGKVLETDPIDKKKITKAKITGCAITPTPKNSSTYAELVKGHISSDEIVFEPIFVKGENNEEISVDEELNILIKSISTESAEEVIPESLEGVKNKKTKSKEKTFLKKVVEFAKSLFLDEEEKEISFSKSLVAENLLKMSPDLETFKNIFTVINQVSDMKINSIKKEDLEKALDSLGLDSAEIIGKIEKGEANGGKTDCLSEAKELVKAGMSYKKSLKSLMEKGYDEKESKDSIIKAMEEEDEEEEDPIDDEGDDDDEPVVKKGTHMSKSLDVEFFKSQFDQLSTNFDEKLKGVGRIVKGLESQIETLSEELSELKNEPIQKSVTSGSFIERSFDNDIKKGEDGKITLSVSKHKREILKSIDSIIPDDYSLIQKGSENDILAQGAAKLESSGFLTDQAKTILKSKGINIVN